MTMNRRNVLIGLGAVAAGGGAVLGSGAFSQTQATRDLTVTVTDDSTAFVTLTEVGTRDAIDTSGNVLSIDLSDTLYSGGGGVNQDATIRIGDGDINTNISADGQGAFEVANNTGGDATLDITITPNSGDIPDSQFTLYFWDEQNSASDSTDATGTATFSGITNPNAIEVAVEIDTTGVSTVTNQPSIDVTADTV